MNKNSGGISFPFMSTKETGTGDQTKEEVTKGRNNQTIFKKIGLQNLILLMVLGIALIFICCLDRSSTKEVSQETSGTTVDAGTTLADNPIYSDSTSESQEYIKDCEERLTNMLSQVEGIGKVQVMITLAESKELVTLKDTPYTQESVNESDAEGGSRITDSTSREDESVMSSAEDGTTSPYVIKEIEPTIQGVVVVAEGGDDVNIQVDIIEAVEALFNISVNKIKVLKMGN